MSPMQTAVVLETMRIVRSAEGDRLRAELMGNVTALRDGLREHDIRCLGEPSAIVPVPIGAENVGRLAFAALWDRGVIANLVEYPAVAIGSARFRMQVQAKHTPAQATAAAHLVAELIDQARAAVG
jgi:glycine C-acetyltransferase/8-amino-7-oxononanoate synthase